MELVFGVRSESKNLSRRLIGVFFIPLLVLTSCASPSPSDTTSSTESTEATYEETFETDILTRLNDEGTYLWEEDPFSPITDTTVEHIYFGGGCAVWVFPSYADVSAENDGGSFDFYDGEVWYGEDYLSEKGVALLTDSKDSRCGRVVFQVLDWSVEEESDGSDSSWSIPSMEGTWGSYSWMDDRVGAFLVIRSAGEYSYTGTFYTQGQSGGVFKDSMIDLVDIGNGRAEVTWPSGNVTIASWGKRDDQTPSSMDPSWIGDIWFDCLGELDFAESRADCNFYLSDE